MDPARQTTSAGQQSGCSARLDNHFRDSDGPCRAPGWHFDGPRRVRRAKEVAQLPTAHIAAGSKSGHNPQLDSHVERSSSGLLSRAPYLHFDGPIRGRRPSPPPFTDPISLRYEESAPSTPKSIRRTGYSAKSATGSWSLSPRGRELLLSGAATSSPEEHVQRSRSEEPTAENRGHGASLRSRSAAHSYWGGKGNYFLYVAGEEDMSPGGTRMYTKCDLPPSPRYVQQNDQLENRVRPNHTHKESADMQYVFGSPRAESRGLGTAE